MENPAEHIRLYEQIVNRIQAQILSGELQPGNQLPSERELTRQFGVSRTAVREAMKTLREKGLVEVRLGRGTYVINKTSRAAQRSLNLAVKIGQASGWSDLVEVRNILEPEIAALAARRATPDFIAAMQKTLDVLESPSDDTNIWAEADSDFHILLAEAANNTVMPILLDSIIEVLHDLRRRLLQLEGRSTITHAEHKRILDAVARGDADAAREAMRAHLERVQSDIAIIAQRMNYS